ncbi:MAG: tryptophan--tRNA ligase [Planctomycetes bacterium]|nr:tryptophan--tRNA ligase [Planctomycetota bacterium]MCW8135939.1 tryptophan--tRNA ligase [Planctomycetota bacterium]
MRILSGVQPSGKLHIGNYFGAIRQFVDLQHKGHGLYFIADLHALTTIRDAAVMRELCFDVALNFLALGLDPARATLFKQSDVPEVSELQWILSTVTPMGLLERAHSYKDKTAKGISPDHGLFAYPVLMAADILIYHSDLVPVGKDQKQHLEITRDIAVKFNQTYCRDFDPHTGEGGVLKLPKPHILEEAAVVPGIDGEKMSKSYNNTIDLFGPEKETRKRIMSIKTDSTPLEAPKNAETCNVFALLKLFASPAELADIRAQYEKGGVGYGDFKKRLADYFFATFGEARKRYDELRNNQDYVHEVLGKGAEKAREIAAELMDDVRRVTGLR